MSAIPLGKPWGDEAESPEVREYAERMHKAVREMVERAASMAVSHFAGLSVPQTVVARTIIISLIEAAADETAHYLAGFGATDEQAKGTSEAYAGLLMVAIQNAFPDWREKVAAMAANHALWETRQ